MAPSRKSGRLSASRRPSRVEEVRARAAGPGRPPDQVVGLTQTWVVAKF